MQERIGNWIWTSALLLAACGSADAPGSLAKSRAALGPSSTTASASFAPPAGGHSCRSDADCAADEECESEHGQYYCARRHGDKDYYGADAGAPPQECHHHGQNCSAGASPDAGSSADCTDEHHDDAYSDDGGHPGGEYSDDDEHDERDDDDRSGSNRGPH